MILALTLLDYLGGAYLLDRKKKYGREKEGKVKNV